MYDLNTISISGRFVSEGKTYTTKSGRAVLFGTIAVRTRAPKAQFKKDDPKTWTVPTFIDFTAFGPIAGRMEQISKKGGLKGKHVILTGELVIRANESEKKGVTFKNASVRVRDFVIDGYPKKANEPEEFPEEPEIPEEDGAF